MMMYTMQAGLCLLLVFVLFILCSKQISVLSITLIHSLLLIVSLLLPTCSKLPKTLSSDFKLLLQKLLVSFWNSNSIQCTSALIFLSSSIKKRKKEFFILHPNIIFPPSAVLNNSDASTQSPTPLYSISETDLLYLLKAFETCYLLGFILYGPYFSPR